MEPKKCNYTGCQHEATARVEYANTSISSYACEKHIPDKKPYDEKKFAYPYYIYHFKNIEDR